MFFPALLAKFLAAGAMAQAATGVGIAVVAFTGAGATGLLGDDVQTTLTSVVSAADETTGAVSSPESSEPTETEPAETSATPAAEITAPADTAFDAKAWASDGPTGAQSFGEWVSQGAHNKDALEAAARALGEDFRFGQVVSSWAHKKHVDLSEVAGLDDVEGVDDPTPTATPTPEVETETEHATEATHGHGNSGHGGGNSGHGHN